MRLRRLLVLLALALAAGASTAQAIGPAPTKKAKEPASSAVKKNVRPAWAELTAEQQATLAPLNSSGKVTFSLSPVWRERNFGIRPGGRPTKKPWA